MTVTKGTVQNVLQSYKGDDNTVLDVDQLIHRIKFIAEIKAIVADMDAGNGIEHEEVVKMIDSWED